MDFKQLLLTHICGVKMSKQAHKCRLKHQINPYVSIKDTCAMRHIWSALISSKSYRKIATQTRGSLA